VFVAPSFQYSPAGTSRVLRNNAGQHPAFPVCSITNVLTPPLACASGVGCVPHPGSTTCQPYSSQSFQARLASTDLQTVIACNISPSNTFPATAVSTDSSATFEFTCSFNGDVLVLGDCQFSHFYWTCLSMVTHSRHLTCNICVLIQIPSTLKAPPYSISNQRRRSQAMFSGSRFLLLPQRLQATPPDVEGPRFGQLVTKFNSESCEPVYRLRMAATSNALMVTTLVPSRERSVGNVSM
jgi:hypothetical protein